MSLSQGLLQKGKKGERFFHDFNKKMKGKGKARRVNTEEG